MISKNVSRLENSQKELNACTVRAHLLAHADWLMCPHA